MSARTNDAIRCDTPLTLRRKELTVSNPTSSNSPTDAEPVDGAAATHVMVVTDASGSMSPLQGFVIEETNRLVEALDPSVRVTFVQFDSQEPFKVVVDEVPAAEIAPLTADDYQPRGGTPLYDAVVKAVRAAAGQAATHEALTGETARVVFAIISDGQENASTDYDATQVRRLLEFQQETGWTVQFLGLGIDAFTEGARLGIRRDSTLGLAHSHHGTAQAFDAISRAATRRPGRDGDR
jgi:Mg-chelatase subunit ChlD